MNETEPLPFSKCAQSKLRPRVGVAIQRFLFPLKQHGAFFDNVISSRSKKEKHYSVANDLKMLSESLFLEVLIVKPAKLVSENFG